MRRFAKGCSQSRGAVTAETYVPLSYAPGEAYQFDWSHEVVVISGVTVTVKVAPVRFCLSRMRFARAYMRESQEIVFDAYDRGFGFFRGTCTRGIHDNMKTAVEAVFIGKELQYNRRFLQMCNHYLVRPVACTPASGWEKGQVENQVGLVRERFFTPRLRVKSLDELNAWLPDECVAYAKAHRHPEEADKTIWKMFEIERPHLVPYVGRFDGFQSVPAHSTIVLEPKANKVSSVEDLHGAVRHQQILGLGHGGWTSGGGACLCRADRHPAGWRGGRRHARALGRGQTVYDPWHYVPVLARKPGAARAMVPPSRTGCFRPQWLRSGAS